MAAFTGKLDNFDKQESNSLFPIYEHTSSPKGKYNQQVKSLAELTC